MATRVKSGSVQVLTKDGRQAVLVKWLTPSNAQREAMLTCADRRIIEERSGLPTRRNNAHLADLVGIPLTVLVEYQRIMGIDIRRRERAYAAAIRQAIVNTHAMGFPLSGTSGAAVPMDVLDMFL